MRNGTPPPLDLWAGIECTVNRVGDRYFDQLEWNGHAWRADDLDRFAALGVRTLRYPVLWERTAPHGLDRADWSWPDERLGRLRELGIRPIVGLVHHGSGPRSTNLLEPSFATGLAAYAGAVAARYPWVADYTPVNEPLTTGRFSALYGHWYPHTRDPLAWARAQLNQCRATVLAMRAVRAANPRARLVQTDDLGKTYSTPHLAYQAEFDNSRRWLTFDLLCGKVDLYHPMWRYLTHVGIAPDELTWFRENRCPPDIIGINTYLGSVRFLDERVDQYPHEPSGGNGRDTYVDVAAARVVADLPIGPYALLREAWERYRLPLAVTEAHNAGPREEQLRWQVEAWDAATRLRDEGADVRAVTVWSLLGTYNWNTLVTRPDGMYEPGVFDVRGPEPRPTAVAAMVQARAAGESYDHPILDTPGWWRREERFHHPAVTLGLATGKNPSPLPGGRPRWLSRLFGGDMSPAAAALPSVQFPKRDPRPLLIVGAGGVLGQMFARLCATRPLAHVALTRAELDITDAAAVAVTLEVLRPWAVVNAASFSRVDDAEREQAACMAANADGPAVLAAACAARGVALLTFSADLVFGGAGGGPHVEHDPVAPLSVYGASKAEGERRLFAAHPEALVVRTGPLFGPWDGTDFVRDALHALETTGRVRVPEGIRLSPAYMPPLVHTCLDLLVDGERDVWHLVHPSDDGAATWGEIVRTMAAYAGYDPAAVEERPAALCGLVAPRPANAALGSGRGYLLPPLDESLRAAVREGGYRTHRTREVVYEL